MSKTHCSICGLPYAHDNDTPHECPPGFQISKPHSVSRLELIQARLEMNPADPNGPAWQAAYMLDVKWLVEQFDALRLAATRQLTPLDVAATHIDILRRKSEDYTPQERDNVAVIVESHVKEARAVLFAAISNPAKSPVPSTKRGVSHELQGPHDRG